MTMLAGVARFADLAEIRRRRHVKEALSALHAAWHSLANSSDARVARSSEIVRSVAKRLSRQRCWKHA
jgi:hypothetical protein